MRFDEGTIELVTPPNGGEYRIKATSEDGLVSIEKPAGHRELLDMFLKSFNQHGDNVGKQAFMVTIDIHTTQFYAADTATNYENPYTRVWFYCVFEGSLSTQVSETWVGLLPDGRLRCWHIEHKPYTCRSITLLPEDRQAAELLANLPEPK